MNIAKKETPKDKLLFGIPTSTQLIYMVVYDMWKYIVSHPLYYVQKNSFYIIFASYFQYHSTFEYKLLENK